MNRCIVYQRRCFAKHCLIEAVDNEDWDAIDEFIAQGDYVKDPMFYDWAFELTKEDRDDRRDLGVSVLEKSKFEGDDFDRMKRPIYELMINDSHCYVRYRSAFCLVNQGVFSENGLKVVNFQRDLERTLNEAKDDDETKDIAIGYLDKLKE